MKFLELFKFFNRKNLYDTYDSDKYIIFSWTRTGSSNLGHIIELNEKIKYIAEPFNLDKKVIKHKPKDVKELKQILKKDIWSQYNCLKHNHGLSREQNEYLLAHPQHKIVFLWRKNALQRTVSQQIALKTNIWGLNQQRENKIGQMQNLVLPELDIGLIKKDVDNYLEDVFYYKDYIKKKGIEVFEVTFESVFKSQELENKKHILENIFKFLNLDFPNDKEKLLWRLNPSNMKQSKHYDYNTIPNIKQIKSLESPLFGHL